MTEAELQVQVADYLRLRYPDVLFHSDFGSGVKLTPGQAKKQKRQNGGRKGWPDMFIAEPFKVYVGDNPDDTDFIGYRERDLNAPRVYVGGNSLRYYGGLFLELKKEGTRLEKKNGEWATPHIAEQAEILGELRRRGYRATFAVGFDEAKRIIDEYLKEKK